MEILCGVDIIEIERVKSSLETIGQTFRDRVFTPGEVEYCEARKAARFASYAARFAAKEAVSKALGTGIGAGVEWKDIEVANDGNGKPYVLLRNKAKERFDMLNGTGVSLSLSHSNSHAVAYAVIYTA